jgi:hypothetical protein
MRRQSEVAAGRLDGRQAPRVGFPVDLDQLPGLELRVRGRVVEIDAAEPAAAVANHREHRVSEQVHCVPALGAHHAERIDEERHIVGDDHDDRVRGCESVARRIRVEHADQRAPTRAHAAERELGERRAREVLGTALHEVELRDAVVEVPRQAVGGHRQALASRAARRSRDAVDDGLSRGGDSA